jgi:hypothetical protein
MGAFSQFSVARELWQRGDLEQALAEVDRVVGLFGKSVEALESKLANRLIRYLGSEVAFPTIS